MHTLCAWWFVRTTASVINTFTAQRIGFGSSLAGEGGVHLHTWRVAAQAALREVAHSAAGCWEQPLVAHISCTFTYAVHNHTFRTSVQDAHTSD